MILAAYDELGRRLRRTSSTAISPSPSGTPRAARLMLARDRMGVRPLFYTWHRRLPLFASEVKALFAVPGIRPSSTRSRSTRSSPSGSRSRRARRSRASASCRRRMCWSRTPDEVFVAPLLAAGLSRCRRRRRHDRRGEGADRRGAARAARRCHAHPPARRRAGRRLSLRRPRLLDHRAQRVHGIVADRLRTFSVTFDSAEFDESGCQHEMVAGARHRAQPRSAASGADIGRMLSRGDPRTPSGRSCAPPRRRSSRSAELVQRRAASRSC